MNQLAAPRHAAGPKGYAYVFILYGSKCEHYFLGAVMTAWSLMKHLSVHYRVLLHTPDIPRVVLDLARALDVFDEVLLTDYIEASEVFFSTPNAHRRFSRIFTKYRVLGLEQYEKVLLLDTDLFVRANIDCLFDLQPPAGMARGKVKHPHGEVMPPRTPVNAGVMLMRPDAALLGSLVEELTGPRPRRTQNYNSPDSDFLTEVIWQGQWRSIPLEFNFQLEYEALDISQGTIRFSAAREEHFSEANASMPWAALKVAHFSGAKPWAHLLEDASMLKRLKGASAGAPKPLVEKLVDGLREYAQEVCELQSLCSQLQLGEGVLWREAPCAQKSLPMSAAVARARLHAFLPRNGRWFEGHRANAVVWVPPGVGVSMIDTPSARPSPVPVYLEVAEPPVAIGSAVRPKAGGSAGPPFKVSAISSNGQMVTLQRRKPLPPHWQVATDNESGCQYYHNAKTGQVQWEYPELPENWEPITDDDTGLVYYHNTQTDETVWLPPPDFEELEILISELEVEQHSGSGPKRDSEVVVTIWRRSFLDDPDLLSAIHKALVDAAAIAGEH